MKCKKCGCDTVFKHGDWYKCENCGAEFFDTEVKVNNITSPTKEVERIEQNDVAQPSAVKVKKQQEPKSKMREAVDFCIPIVVAVIIAILLKTLVFANAVVPTGSMLNTIQEGDRIIASRLAYVKNDPERYDIVMFHYPDNKKQIYVKRIIGLPGETVLVRDGVVYVTQTDGKQIKLRDDFITNCTPTGNYGPYTVPEDCYFMMGDNRNDSWDSRFWDNKYVERSEILGKVKFRYLPSIGKIE